MPYEKAPSSGAFLSLSLMYFLSGKPMHFCSGVDTYIMRPPLQFQNKRLFEHVGEELMFVLSGNVEVEVSGKFIRLGEGDTLYFDSHLPHRSRSLGKKYAQVLVVITGIG